MIALKPLFLVALLAGTSSAFAVIQPGSPIAKPTKMTTSSALRMSGGAVGATPPELKVNYPLTNNDINTLIFVSWRRQKKNTPISSHDISHRSFVGFLTYDRNLIIIVLN